MGADSSSPARPSCLAELCLFVAEPALTPVCCFVPELVPTPVICFALELAPAQIEVLLLVLAQERAAERTSAATPLASTCDFRLRGRGAVAQDYPDPPWV